VRDLVLPKIEVHGAIEAWIIDDTAFRKKGRHSVGVARQYCGEVGKQDNCQVAVSLSLANAYASLPVAFRLNLPKEWADDAARRNKAKVPADMASLELAQGHGLGAPSGIGQAALAHLARLSGSQAGSGSLTSKAEAGAACITTPRWPSPLTASSSWNGPFPPQALVKAGQARRLSFPPIIDPAAPPIRPERHIPNSIATMRRRLTVALLRRLPRCPCCGQSQLMTQ